jgi:hypothetical protein
MVLVPAAGTDSADKSVALCPKEKRVINIKITTLILI